MKKSKVLYVSLAAAGGLWSSSAMAASVAPTVPYGYMDCKSLGYEELKFEPVYQGMTTKDGVTVKVYGGVFEWTSKYGVDVVIARSGYKTNVYTYPAPGEATADTKLYAPTQPGYESPPLSQISFCYDLSLEIKKTAKTSFKRVWEWYIEKSADYAEEGATYSVLKLMLDKSQIVKYLVEVSRVYTDSYFAVEGTITIKNPTAKKAKITSVVDVLSDGTEMTVTCPYAPPFTLDPYKYVDCTYKGMVQDGKYDKYLENTVTVESEYVEGGTATAAVDFKEAYINEIDECVYVTDTFEYATGLPATVCAKDGPKSFAYDRTIGPYTDEYCGYDKEIVVYNTATFKTNDTATTGSSTWNVKVDLACIEGCTLTQGYWKTHSEKGPAPYDDTWKYLPKGAYTPFFYSGKTWHEVFWTPPAGNAYYQCAHQYMATMLNTYTGASTTPEVDAAIKEAEAYFAKYKPDAYMSKSQKAKVLAWATLFDQYNNGYIGPGKCSE